MTVLNDLDHYHLAGDVVDQVPRLARLGGYFKQFIRNKLVEHKQYVCKYGEDMTEIPDYPGAGRVGHRASVLGNYAAGETMRLYWPMMQAV